jgi:hypothetical protein
MGDFLVSATTVARERLDLPAALCKVGAKVGEVAGADHVVGIKVVVEYGYAGHCQSAVAVGSRQCREALFIGKRIPSCDLLEVRAAKLSKNQEITVQTLPNWAKNCVF